MITMPSADFCAAFNRTYERFSPDAPDTTQISRGKFDRLRRTPAESTETGLDGYGLRGRRPARPPETASYPVLVHRATTVATRFLQTPPRGGSPCASPALHLHQVVQGTSTPRLSNMLGTPILTRPQRGDRSAEAPSATSSSVPSERGARYRDGCFPRAVGLRAGYPRVGQPGLCDGRIMGSRECLLKDAACDFLAERRGGICGQNRKSLVQLKWPNEPNRAQGDGTQGVSIDFATN